MTVRTLLLCVAFVPTPAWAGLDVTAYEKLTQVAAPQLDRDGEPMSRDQVKLTPITFPERFAGLKPGAVYRYGNAFEFRAGPYSSYSEWRNALAKLGGHGATPFKTFKGTVELRHDATVWALKRGPFWELIDFSDAEGVIGPVVCKRVLKDFVDFETAASRHPDEWFRFSYGQWKKAFSVCANDGAIVFH